MASSSSLVGNLEKELECSICLNIYTNPKTLPCLHTFCCHCLNELAEKSRETRQPIACPECRIIIELPRGNSFDEFPTACYLNRLKGYVSVQLQENQDDLKYHEEAAEAAKSRLRETEAKAQERAVILRKQEHRNNDILRKNRQQIKQTRGTIKQNCQRLMELLKRHEQELLTEVDTVEEAAEKMFVDQTELLKLRQGQLNSIIEHLRSVRQRGISEVITAEPSAMSQTQEVFDALANYQPLKTVHVEYKPDEDVSRRLESSPMGRVCSGLANPQTTQIQGLETIDLIKSDANSPVYVHVTKGRPRGYKAVATFGSRGSGRGQFRCPRGIAVNRAGEVAVSDSDNHRVQIFSADGQYLREFGTKGTADGQFSYPAGLAYSKAGDIVVADELNSRIQVFSPTGCWISKFGQDALQWPHSVSVTSDDNMVVCDIKEMAVNVFSRQGVLLLKISAGILPHCAIFCDEKYFVSVDSHVIKVFDSRGSHIYDIGQRGSEAGQFNYPRGLAVNTSHLLLVSDKNNHRVQAVTLDGEFVTSFGSNGSELGQFSHPTFIAVSSDGRVFVTDQRVQVFQAQY